MAELRIPADKYIIGLTGNIATGKSVIMNLAQQRGALAIDADKIVHEILAQDKDVQTAIVDAFGARIQEADGSINRSALGNIVFGDAHALRQLEMIIHPAVYPRVLKRMGESTASIVIIEAIKLLEGKLRGLCDAIWVAHCSREQQLERLRVCRGLDRETAALRIDSQPPQEEKVRQADVIIDTGGLMEETRNQFETAWSNIPQQN
jgi:dephospho-CoA kinase